MRIVHTFGMERPEGFAARLERVATLLACIEVSRIEAIERLGISERCLRERLRRYGIGQREPVAPSNDLYQEASELIDQLDDWLMDAVFQKSLAHEQ